MKPLPRATSTRLVLAAMICVCAGARAQAPANPQRQFELLDPASVEPGMLLPAPPAPGSAAERAELAELHALIASATAARIAQARRDDALEDPSIFDDAAGRPLHALPATWALLKTVQNDADLAVNLAKGHFDRVRPYGTDPSLHSCEAGPPRKPTRSYPSGHAGLAYSVGYVLARLLPERAPQILARASDYALSREYCAVHYPSDTEASHVIGALVASRLLDDPRLAARIAAARAELARR